MRNRLYASIALGFVTAVVGGTLVLVGRLLGDAVEPLVVVALGVGLAAFIIDTIFAWFETP